MCVPLVTGGAGFMGSYVAEMAEWVERHVAREVAVFEENVVKNMPPSWAKVARVGV